MTSSFIFRRTKKIDKRIGELKKRLMGLPEGKFILAQNGKHYKWYVSDGKNKTYIPKGNIEYAQQLAYKHLLTLQITNLINERKALQAYQKYRDEKLLKKEKDCFTNPEFLKLLSPYLTKQQLSAQKWMNKHYPQNTKYPEFLKHNTANGNVVRSKSESMIEQMLCEHNLAFHYEEPMNLGELEYHPDYRIAHPITGKIYIWENVGMIDKPDYLRKFILRFQDYIANGYIPGVNLILTFETEEHPLTTEQIEKIIEMYFE